MQTTKWVKRAEVARRLGVSDMTVDAMVKRGDLPTPKKVGTFQQSPVLLDEAELNVAIERLMKDRL